jgi:hypothetical protein
MGNPTRSHSLEASALPREPDRVFEKPQPLGARPEIRGLEGVAEDRRPTWGAGSRSKGEPSPTLLQIYSQEITHHFPWCH